MNSIRKVTKVFVVFALIMATAISFQQKASCQGSQPQQLLQQAEQLNSAGKFGEAKQAITAAVQLAPNNDIYINYLSWCDYLTGSYAEGTKLGIQALKMNLKVPSYYNTVAFNAYGNQDFAQARDYFRRGADSSVQFQDRVHYDEALKYLQLLSERTFVVTWTLDPAKGNLKDGSLYLPVPPAHLPYQDAKIEVTGATDYTAVTHNGNDFIAVRPNGNAPFQLTLTVTTRPFTWKDKLTGPQGPPDASLPKEYLGKSWAIDPHSSAVQGVITQIGRASTDVEQVRRIITWLKQNIRYQTPHQYNSVDEIISRKWTECGGFSDLFTALARASNIPARQVWGVINDEGQFAPPGHFKGHAWTEFYLPTVGWVPTEPQSITNVGSLKTDYIRICNYDVIADLWPTDDLWGMDWDMPLCKETFPAPTAQK